MTEIQLFEAIQNGATVLTANRRLAGFFQQKFAVFQLQRKQSVWISPAIQSFQDYLLNAWTEFENQQLSATKTLLTAFQSELLWREIIEKTALNEELLDDLLNLDATINTTVKAWELIHAFNLSHDTLPVPTRIDEYAFQLWAANYQEYLIQNRYFDQATLCNEISDLVKKNKKMPPNHIIFSGFDTFTPQQKSFIAILEEQNCQVTFFDFSLTPSFIGKLSCIDEREEFELAAAFCKQQLLKGCNSIAVVVPKLQQKRSEIERVFSAIPQNFNISAGKALSDYPVIDMALTLLALTQKPIALNTLSYVIRSPFILGSETEMIERQKLDHALKDYAQIEIPFKKLLELSQKQDCEQFLMILKQTLSNSSEKSCTDWSYFFLEKLKNWGWPGERSIESEEFQTIERFKILLLDEFSKLTLVSKKVSFSTAIEYLKKLCQQTIFQAKKIEQAPIQILGLLEASGMTYEKMWVTGLTEKEIPTAPTLNPFLAIDMQRQLQMPHSSVEREYQFSKKLVERLTQSADEIILSFPCHVDDETMNPSSLIDPFTMISKETLNLTIKTHENNLFHLETIPHGLVPFNITKELLRGGSSVLKEQSLCSFRAFAIHRLHCKSLPMAEFSVSARDRGNIIHKVLEMIWGKLQSKENLKNSFSENNDFLFIEFISKEIEEVLHQYDLANAIFEVEKQHLIELLLQYFKAELQRDDFVVCDIEKNIEISLKNFKLKLRIDRIDQLQDGNIAIIDYKTSECKIGEWFGERPTAPQLPLYAAFYQPAPAQLLFAQLKRGSCEFIGISAEETENKNIKTLEKTKLTTNQWQQQITEWRITCEKLMEDFQQGDIVLNPHPVKKPCKACDIKTLCRIFESNEHDSITD